MMRRSRRRRRQAAAKRRALLRKAAQLKQENKQIESDHMEGLSKQAPVTEEQQQSPLAAIEEVLVYYIKNKFEQQKALEQSLTLTCPSPMSCSHHKEEMLELVKKRIIEIEGQEAKARELPRSKGGFSPDLGKAQVEIAIKAAKTYPDPHSVSYTHLRAHETGA